MILTKFTTAFKHAPLLAIALLADETNAQTGVLWSNHHMVAMPNNYADRPAIGYDQGTQTITVTGRENTPQGQRLSAIGYSLTGDVTSELLMGSDLVNSDDYIIDYKIDNQHNTYILQHKNVDTNLWNTVLQKYLPNGTLAWVKELSDPLYSYTPMYLSVSNDGSHVFACITKEIFEFDFSYNISRRLYMYDNSGNELSVRTFNPETELDWVLYMISDNSGVIFLGTDTTTVGNPNHKIIKVDNSNNLVTNVVSEAPGNLPQYNADGNILLTSSNRVSKVSQSGTLIWSGPVVNNTYYEAIQTIQDQDGNIYVTGRYWPAAPDTNNDILTTKYDNTGTMIWQNIYQYGGQNAEMGETLFVKNGAVYVGGQSQDNGIDTDYDYVVLKIDGQTGASEGTYRYGAADNGDDQVTSLYVLDNGNIALTGLSHVNSGVNQTTQLITEEALGTFNTSFNRMVIWPNPAEKGSIINLSGITGLKQYKMVNTSGQTVLNGLFETTVPTIKTDGLSSGLYLLTITSENGSNTSKVLIK